MREYMYDITYRNVHKSKGAWLHVATTGRAFLDIFMCKLTSFHTPMQRISQWNFFSLLPKAALRRSSVDLKVLHLNSCRPELPAACRNWSHLQAADKRASAVSGTHTWWGCPGAAPARTTSWWSGRGVARWAARLSQPSAMSETTLSAEQKTQKNLMLIWVNI